MLVKLLEPLNVSDSIIEKLAEPIKQAGHEFVYYNEKTTDRAELARRSEGADVIMIANNPYPTEVIDQNANLKLINVAFTGVDHVGIGQARNQDVMVCNAAGYANQAVAELTIGLVLDVYRHITQGDKEIHADNFPGAFQGSEIKGKTVGLIGTGKIGMMTARLFKAFGAKIVASDQSRRNPAAEVLGIEYMELDELLAQSDIVSLHIPLLSSTKGLISKEKLELMKESAILINCARGPIVDNDALADALNEGRIAGAGIDVFDMEPPIPGDYKLLQAKNAILTPHVGFLTNEAMELRAKIAFDNTMAFIEGKPQNIIRR
ncbi:2-hydroxyacid dehydrogenase [Lysinibacillus sp. FSL M8-0216]|uniref:2-hydroxyacid dehydrogenase n=1 Tax=Lysinibacillus TaxID=400634 RepID=UPI00088D5152|nr:2-hydroxyacid dehydrogenase [Lysinibacillus fusiformis]SCX41121.1 D-3-phosphoglycerate dehydrogenase [Lysinibacillus fusiformis]SDB10217.1 D-3-phosphoglycerate dehydrogenase [Lysinibacillus fusiformis]SFH86781.1 D-3-phosphoglycerate dehydrogenase [Lysinibacillus fusiformis]SFS31704.1 D-3-phosphoglycerate dehydrogenase [Lysinibacillus fusiformis]